MILALDCVNAMDSCASYPLSDSKMWVLSTKATKKRNLRKTRKPLEHKKNLILHHAPVSFSPFSQDQSARDTGSPLFLSLFRRGTL